MSIYLAAYDVSSDRRRRRVARTLDSFGHRVQESVFEIWLEPHEVPELRAQVGSMLDLHDSFELVPIDDRGNRSRWRWQRDHEPWSAVLLR